MGRTSRSGKEKSEFHRFDSTNIVFIESIKKSTISLGVTSISNETHHSKNFTPIKTKPKKLYEIVRPTDENPPSRASRS